VCISYSLLLNYGGFLDISGLRTTLKNRNTGYSYRSNFILCTFYEA